MFKFQTVICLEKVKFTVIGEEVQFILSSGAPIFRPTTLSATTRPL
jgi:hypothetical protein